MDTGAENHTIREEGNVEQEVAEQRSEEEVQSANNEHETRIGGQTGQPENKSLGVAQNLFGLCEHRNTIFSNQIINIFTISNEAQQNRAEGRDKYKLDRSKSRESKRTTAASQSDQSWQKPVVVSMDPALKLETNQIRFSSSAVFFFSSISDSWCSRSDSDLYWRRLTPFSHSGSSNLPTQVFATSSQLPSDSSFHLDLCDIITTVPPRLKKAAVIILTAVSHREPGICAHRPKFRKEH